MRMKSGPLPQMANYKPTVSILAPAINLIASSKTKSPADHTWPPKMPGQVGRLREDLRLQWHSTPQLVP